MSRLSRLLAVLNIAVLIAITGLLAWLRKRAIDSLERTVQNAAAAFPQDRILHGPGGNTLVNFAVAENIKDNLLKNANLREAIVTKLKTDKEVPIVPFDLEFRWGKDWLNKLEELQRLPLGDIPETPWGYLYLNVDRSLVTSVNKAIGAIGLAIALVLLVLLGRLWTQETSLTRTTIELHERRRELIRLERLALGGQLAAGLLHDLRKPVMHVEHAIEDLSGTLNESSDVKSALQNLRRQTRLFFEMLAESQFERFVQSDRAGEEFVSIQSILEQSLALVRYERRGVEVVIETANGATHKKLDAKIDPSDEREESVIDHQFNLPPVYAHPFRLVQLFSNLFLNAYQAMAGQGRIDIEISRKFIGNGFPERVGIMVTITDNGPGIPSEVLPHIFEPFFTTKPEGQGTGLGLSICKLIIEDLGGNIDVSSNLGGPTQFRVWLPAAKEPA